ncbi:hypothetical protein PIB30_066490, partial [Stylosanthes scabra]|nr:hypothetical protein [Stylosanthes scabra]
KGLVLEGLPSGPSAEKSTVEIGRSDGMSSKDEPKEVEGHILEDVDGLCQHIVEHERVIGAKVETQSVETNTMKGVLTSHRKILQILWEDYASRKKHGNAAVEGKTTIATAKGVTGKHR